MRPLYVAAVVVIVVSLDLLALDGRTFSHLGLSLQRYQSSEVTNAALIDTLAALTLNGIAFYAIAAVLERRGGDVMRTAAGLLFVISPFSMLEPLAYLVETAEYSVRFDWIYLALAIAVAIASHHRQRKSFYYAGVVNTGVALYLIAARYAWFDRPRWAEMIIAAGLAALVAGFLLDARERRRG